jgi:uncharacterized membrane protein YagU involved in acid resistance
VVLIVSGSLVVAFHSFILPQLFDHASVWKAFLGWMIVWTAIHFIYPMRVSNYERDARSRGPSGPERQD